MAGFFPNGGELNALDTLLQGGGSPMYVGLFKNDFIPDDDTLLEDVVEADFDGYARQELSFPDPSYTNGDGKAENKSTVNTFVKAAGITPNTIYGWFALIYVGEASYDLLCLERFADPASMVDTGEVVSGKTTITLRTE